MPTLRSMNYGVAAPSRYGSHAASRYGSHPASRHAASAVGAASVAPLTIEEYLNLVPSNIPPAPVMALLMSQPYRGMIETGALPTATAAMIARGPALAAKGLNIPARFLPQAAVGPTLEELLRVVAMLYRQMLSDRYAA